jgi:hypothetical protein
VTDTTFVRGRSPGPVADTEPPRRRDPAVTIVEERYARGVLQAAAFVVIFWAFAGDLPTVLSGYSLYRPVGTGLWAWVGYVVLSTIVIVDQFRGGSRWMPVVACPLLLSGVVLTAAATPTGSVLDAYSWLFASSGWCAMVVLWRRSAVQLLAYYTVMWSMGLATLVHQGQTDRVSLARFAVVAYGVAILKFTLLIGGRRLALIAGSIAEANQQHERVAARELAAQAVHDARRGRYEFVQRTAAGLLGRLATDRLDLTDNATQRELRVAIGRLRRLMVETDDVPQPLLHELRSCADQAERRGVEVELVPAVGTLPSLSPPERRALLEPVIQILASAEAHARVTVVASRHDVVVGVVGDGLTDVDATSSVPQVQVSWERDGGGTWAQTRWTAPSP